MCGIAGFINTSLSVEVARPTLERMTSALAHRGPDGYGLYLRDGVGLGHRRLSIIDLDGGKQPMFNEDGTVVVVFNGEIYNFDELKRELSALGHRFATRSDTEVLLHAWEEWGASSVNRLRGMFAYALWDQKSRTYFIARDRLGIKPLYYSWLSGGELIFGSELKALLVHPKLRRSLDPLAVEDYLSFGHIPEPRTILENVQKLQPGHFLMGRSGGENIERRYWDISFRRNESVSSQLDYQHELTTRISESVRIRMIADVPLGAFLSGGVDSSVIAWSMAQTSSTPINTCSIGFAEEAFDEAPYATRIAEQLRSNHHSKIVDGNDLTLLDRLAEVYDEPFADSSALPTYRLSEMTRQHVTVALSGDGGDELFAGYEWYKGHARRERLKRNLPRWIRRTLFRHLASILTDDSRVPGRNRLRTQLTKLSGDIGESFSYSTMITTPWERAALFHHDLRRRLGGYSSLQVVQNHAKQAPTDHPLAFAQYIDMKLYLASDILTKVDRASMAHGLEVRVPFLDHELVEWVCANVPADEKLHKGVGKAILKKSYSTSLPHDILHRPKRGFSVPLAKWTRGPLRERIENLPRTSTLNDCRLFRSEALVRLLDQHYSGKRDSSSLLWALIVLENSLSRLLN